MFPLLFSVPLEKLPPDESSFDPRALTLVEESIKLGMCPGFFLDKGDQTIDLRLMPPAVAEVYIMVLGNAIRAHCAGPGPLGGKRFYNNITLLVPSYNPRAVMLPSGIQQKDGVVPIATVRFLVCCVFCCFLQELEFLKTNKFPTQKFENTIFLILYSRRRCFF